MFGCVVSAPRRVRLRVLALRSSAVHRDRGREPPTHRPTEEIDRDLATRKALEERIKADERAQALLIERQATVRAGRLGSGGQIGGLCRFAACFLVKVTNPVLSTVVLFDSLDAAWPTRTARFVLALAGAVGASGTPRRRAVFVRMWPHNEIQL